MLLKLWRILIFAKYKQNANYSAKIMHLQGNIIDSVYFDTNLVKKCKLLFVLCYNEMFVLEAF